MKFPTWSSWRSVEKAEGIQMKRRLQHFFMGRGSRGYIPAKGLFLSWAETFRTHGWSLLPKYTVPFSSMGNALEFIDDEIQGETISSKGSLSPMANAFRTYNWPLLLKYTVSFSSMGNTAVILNDGEIDEGRRLKPISIPDKDLQLPSFLEERRISSMLEKSLPSMAETFKTEDWSLLQNFHSMDSILNIEEAVKSELAAICVWFLFTNVPPHVKDGAARTLTFISLGTSEATKLSTDQTGVENLMVRILSSGNAEVQRQVCLGLSLLANCPVKWLSVTFFGAAVQDVLLHLVCNLSRNPDVLTYPVLNVVTSIAHGGNGMSEKVVKTELLNSWLVKLLSREDDESIMASACWLLSYIAYERCDSKFWDHVKENFLPRIFEGLFSRTYKIHLLSLRPAVHFLLKISEYGSWDQIDHMVKTGGLEYLIGACTHEEEDEDLLIKCLDAVEAILRVGDAKAKAKAEAEAKAKARAKDGKFEEDMEFSDEDEDGDYGEPENEYADMIDGIAILYENHKDIWGWHVLLLNLTLMSGDHPLVERAVSMVQKYRPLLRHTNIWKFYP